MTDILYLPATDRTPRPWLNGGGITYDVMSSPVGAGPERFDWRLSIAHVVEAGPFSLFAGIDRHLAVLEGTLELRFEGRSLTRSFSPGDAPMAFGGEEVVFGTPVGAPALVLNLMVRRDGFFGHLHPASGPDFATTMPNTILIARHGGRIEIDGVPRPIAALDAIAVAPGHHVRSAAHQLLLSEVSPTPPVLPIATSN